MLATTLDNLKNGERIHTIPEWVPSALTALVLLLLAVAFMSGLSPLPIGVGLLVFSAALVVIGWAVMIYIRLAIPVVSPLLAAWLYFLPAAIRRLLA